MTQQHKEIRAKLGKMDDKYNCCVDAGEIHYAYIDIQNKVINTLCEGWGFTEDENNITCDTTADYLGLDSLDMVELATNIECIFGIAMQDEELEKLKTIGNMVDLIDRTINFK